MKRKQLIAGVPSIFLIIVLLTWFAGTLLTSPVQQKLVVSDESLIPRLAQRAEGSRNRS